MVPEARWRQNLQILASNATHFAHNWLNPQAPTPTQVPTTHENFGLAGDEYKLPVAQNIPDATTDPTQIRVDSRRRPNREATQRDRRNRTAANEDTAPPNTSSRPPLKIHPQTPRITGSLPVQVQETAQPGSGVLSNS